jgi:dolichol kinase
LSLTRNDIVGLILSYLYAFGLLLIVELLGRRRKWPQYLTRKVVHIGAGMWIWGILGIFDTWVFGLIPFATFIILNYIFYRFQIFKMMDAAGASPGTVYFAIAITALFALLWRTDGTLDRAPVAAAAVMAMTWGDGVASIVGQRLGRRSYTVLGHTRTWEGTTAMFVLSFIAIAITLTWLPGSGWSPASEAISGAKVLWLALTGSFIATTAEGLSPAGTDNLTVPLLTGALLYVLI